MLLHGVWTKYQKILNRWIVLDLAAQQYILGENDGKELKDQMDRLVSPGVPTTPEVPASPMG